jgi:c-di-GMP-binding flagellar brake protein YcgR
MLSPLIRGGPFPPTGMPPRMAANNESASSPEAHFTEEEKRFLIGSGTEIAHILQSVVRKASLVTAYYGPNDFVLTSLLEVAPELDRLVFDLPSQRAQTAQLIASREIALVTNQDGIRIKFYVSGAATTTHDDRPALVARLPHTLVRLQRRDSFRVTCPLSNPVMCIIPFTAQGQAQKAELMVIDLSLGGIALINQHPRLNLDVGNVYADCVLTLPDVGSFVSAIEVRNSYQVTLKNGTVTMHAGCRFINPPPDGLTKVHRYTMMQERRRIARFGSG